MSIFKIGTATLAACVFASAASAGSLIPPVAEQSPVIESADDDNDSAGILLPLGALVLIGLAAGGSSGAATDPG